MQNVRVQPLTSTQQLLNQIWKLRLYLERGIGCALLRHRNRCCFRWRCPWRYLWRQSRHHPVSRGKARKDPNGFRMFSERATEPKQIFRKPFDKGLYGLEETSCPQPLLVIYIHDVVQIFTYFIERAFVELQPNNFLLKMLRESQPIGNANLDVDQAIPSAHFPVRRDRAQTLVEISELHDVAVENSARQLCARVVHLEMKRVRREMN